MKRSITFTMPESGSYRHLSCWVCWGGSTTKIFF